MTGAAEATTVRKINDRLLSWASVIEPNTLQQAIKTSSMPFVYPHVALMPDAHLGKGATVGSVLPTLGAIVPAAVGVDIGCGMMAYRLNLGVDQMHEQTAEDWRILRRAIERAVPLSAGKYNATESPWLAPKVDYLAALPGAEHATEIAPNWHLQLGSLGSGNHFIEVCKDEEGKVWLFLHTGSRGVGNKLAQHHIKIAQDLCRRWHISLPDPDLAYLAEGTAEFDDYLRDLRWAQEFARQNREEIMDRVWHEFVGWWGDAVEIEQMINCHHNYTVRERHMGRDVWLTRKGAIEAREGTWGLIPGSMGTASYVVQGKGNRVALNSSPHGAGRRHSRSSAKKTFSRADLDAAMVGIVWGESDAFLDEIPAAYKDIDQVMRDAADLVEIRHTLRQIVNVKGD